MILSTFLHSLDQLLEWQGSKIQWTSVQQSFFKFTFYNQKSKTSNFLDNVSD